MNRPTFSDRIATTCERSAARAALIYPSAQRTLNCAQLLEQMGRVHAVLNRQGVRAGDVVSLVIENRLDLILTALGVLTYGAVANPISPMATRSGTDAVVRHARPRVIVTDRAALDVAVTDDVAILRPGAWADVIVGASFSPESTSDGGLLIYTSGTTGDPKGVLLSPANLLHNVDTALSLFDYVERHTTACILPVYHTFGIVSDVLAALLSGGTCVLGEQFDVRRLGQFADACREHHVNSYSAVPILFETLLRLRVDLRLPNLRFAVAGAAPLAERTAEDYLVAYGHPIYPCYGLTETTCFATISNRTLRRTGSVGKPAAVEIAVLNEQGETCPRGECGELAMRGGSVMTHGYFRNNAANQKSIRNGWFLTGDIGSQDSDGYVFIKGRKKNMIIRGGEKVYLDEIGRLLASSGRVADAIAVPVLRQQRSEKFVLLYVPSSAEAPVLEQELRNLIVAHLGSKYVPDELLRVEQIERSPTGKAIYHAAIERAAQEGA